MSGEPLNSGAAYFRESFDSLRHRWIHGVVLGALRAAGLEVVPVIDPDHNLHPELSLTVGNVWAVLTVDDPAEGTRASREASRRLAAEQDASRLAIAAEAFQAAVIGTMTATVPNDPAVVAAYNDLDRALNIHRERIR